MTAGYFWVKHRTKEQSGDNSVHYLEVGGMVDPRLWALVVAIYTLHW